LGLLDTEVFLATNPWDIGGSVFIFLFLPSLTLDGFRALVSPLFSRGLFLLASSTAGVINEL
jgi:hypothetical protein